MKKIIIVALIGLLMAMGLVLIGCEGGLPNCQGNGECTVTISQNASGLYRDTSSPQSTCGKKTTSEYDSNSSKYVEKKGCNVQDNIDNKNRTYGTHSCNC